MRSNSRALRLRATGLAFASIWLFTLVAAKGLQPIVPWRRVQQILNDPNFQIYLGLGLGSIAAIASWYYYQESTVDERQNHPVFVLRWNFIAILAVISLALAALLARWLLDIATDAATRIDAIKTTLAFAAGCGAAIALLITMRRQWHQEKATQESDFDATEQRVTDLYSKAVDQLGASQLSTRLGGIYSLERLAQGNPRHQQTIVYMLCAHLRVLDSGRDRRLLGPNAELSDYVLNADEHEITSAIIGILRRHRDTVSRTEYWEAAHILDFSGANLALVDLHRIDLRYGTFVETIFAGSNLRSSDLYRADLSGGILDSAILRRANVRDALLHGASLRNADLSYAYLNNADLTDAHLDGATLSNARWNSNTKWPRHLTGFVNKHSVEIERRRYSSEVNHRSYVVMRDNRYHVIREDRFFATELGYREYSVHADVKVPH